MMVDSSSLDEVMKDPTSERGEFCHDFTELEAVDEEDVVLYKMGGLLRSGVEGIGGSGRRCSLTTWSKVKSESFSMTGELGLI